MSLSNGVGPYDIASAEMKTTARIGLMIVLFCSAARAADVETRSWEVLSTGLSDSNPTKRAQAIAAVATIGSQRRAVAALESALSDKEDFIRITAAAAIGEKKRRQAIPKLRGALNDESAQVRFAAAKALWQMGDHHGRRILMGVLAGEEKISGSFVQDEIREAKTDIHNPTALAKIGIREGAGTLFGPLGMGVGFAEDILKDKGAPARVSAAKLLAQDSSSKSLDQLEIALEDKNSAVRAAAACALADRSNSTAIARIEPLLDDKSEAARYMAAAAIIRLSAVRRRKLRTPGASASETHPGNDVK